MYGALFFVTLPTVHQLGEGNRRTTLAAVAWDICASMMIVLSMDELLLILYRGEH